VKWLVFGGVSLLAALLRIMRLDQPETLVFDETYYVKDAWTLINTGAERNWPSDFDDQFTSGEVNGFLETPSFVAHPPLGKLLIGLGLKIFGPNPMGWRIMAAIFGVGLVLLLMLIIDHLLGNVWLAVGGGLLLSIDGLAIVLSRTALLDIFLAFLILLAFYCLLGNYPTAMFVALGAALGVKWSALWFLVGFSTLFLISRLSPDWQTEPSSARFGPLVAVQRPKIGPPLFSCFRGIAISGLGYLLCWTPWILTDTAYGKTPLAKSGGSFGQLASDFFEYHLAMLGFNLNLVTEHAYNSPAYQWLLQIRPTYFYYETVADDRVESVTSLGNPLIWWVGTLALIVMLMMAIRSHNRLAGYSLFGLISGWLPWVLIPDRTKFAFYAIIFEAFVIMAIVLGVKFWFERHPKSARVGTIILACLTLGVSVYLYPIWVAIPVEEIQFGQYFWLGSWV
jgi:dolichyl-phosphate-mannose--protein O-mannosyl transferase